MKAVSDVTAGPSGKVGTGNPRMMTASAPECAPLAEACHGFHVSYRGTKYLSK